MSRSAPHREMMRTVVVRICYAQAVCPAYRRANGKAKAGRPFALAALIETLEDLFAIEGAAFGHIREIHRHAGHGHNDRSTVGRVDEGIFFFFLHQHLGHRGIDHNVHLLLAAHLAGDATM